MKILFVFTGGTIGSTLGEKYISLDHSKVYTLIQEYEKQFGIRFEYDVAEPYITLSEHNTGETIKSLIQCISENKNKDYDGIIVTHGTDTIQYSAAALSYALGTDCIPICLVSSNYPLEDPRANGLQNLHGAVKLIERKQESGVWVVYKNTNDVTKVHRGSRLLANQAFSDALYSIYDSFYGYFDEAMSFHPNPNYKEEVGSISCLPYEHLEKQCREILILEPYVGMRYPKLTPDVKYVIFNSYHSGTINTKDEAMQEFCKETQNFGIRLFITGVSKEVSYESVSHFDELHILPLCNLAPIAAYIKLWMGIGMNPEQISDMMNTAIGDDICK